eukprot:TRINITY_DN1802_c0_g1_i3.p1 TRINITY_DN1802_c0_g1~~TRINITY_DN1802_c0_g1_i3.p1  ORF type:complete len:474 (+),score=183.62 TRINITY_DN1802_c0_g1_i3:54-1424(+)
MEQAANMIQYYNSFPASVRSKIINCQFSNRTEITPPAARGSGGDDDTPPNRILLVSFSNIRSLVTIEHLQQTFSQYGQLAKIVTFEKRRGELEAFIEFKETEDAIRAKQALNGKEMFLGSCRLRVGFSRLGHLTAKANDLRSRDFTHPLRSVPMNMAQHNAMAHEDFKSYVPASNSAPGSNSSSSVAPSGWPSYVDPYSYNYPPSPNPSPNLGINSHNMPVGVGMSMGVNYGHNGAMYGVMAAQDGCVLLVSNLPETLSDHPDRLFVLFGLYGDVHRVKILHKKKSTAMVQFATPDQAQVALSYLNRLEVFGCDLAINVSKYKEILLRPVGVQLNVNVQNEDRTKDYIDSKAHRFRIANSKNAAHICAPTNVLHFSNLPPNFSEADLSNMTSTDGLANVQAVRFLKQAKNESKMALVAVGDRDEAIRVLLRWHNQKIGGKWIRVSFSNRSITANHD